MVLWVVGTVLWLFVFFLQLSCIFLINFFIETCADPCFCLVSEKMKETMLTSPSALWCLCKSPLMVTVYIWILLYICCDSLEFIPNFHFTWLWWSLCSVAKWEKGESRISKVMYSCCLQSLPYIVNLAHSFVILRICIWPDCASACIQVIPSIYISL